MSIFSISVPDDVPPIMRANWIHARKVNAEEWVDEDGEPRSVYHSGYSDDPIDSVAEFMEGVRAIHQEGETWPTWCWGTRETPFRFSADAILEAHFGETDIPESAIKQLEASMNAWADRWLENSTMDIEDTSVVVLLPPNWWLEAVPPSSSPPRG